MQQEPKCEKFRYKGLKFHDKLMKLFDGNVATGKHAFILGATTQSLSLGQENDTTDTTMFPPPPTTVTTLNLHKEGTSYNNNTQDSTSTSTLVAERKQKKAKTSNKEALQTRLASVGSFVEAYGQLKDNTSMGRCLQLLKEDGIDVDSELYLYAIMRFESPDLREAFVDITPPSHRLRWLKMRYDAWISAGKPMLG